MTTSSRDLFNSFGKLMQNRAFMMAVMHQREIAGMDGMRNNGRGQMRLLQLLSQSPDGLTNAEIAELLDIRPSSVSATISRLEDAELVERIPSERDKRAVIVRLSENGQKLFANHDDKVDDLTDKLFSGLTDEDKADLQRLLTKLSHSVADLDLRDFMPRGGEMHHHGGWGRRWF
ncbi:MarR family winged helix-turn-helix transcriptional regulator [Lactiplantibacillus mudanjiangensis]|uniref:MarR family transcriptional regulator [Lactobacillus sp.] n=1 Tax=Lactiplantibacillus mudanjiangensis TaxID=1296538 RepID=A0A660EAQ5_9LACO|nr:MarR family transcriptional regulator [Lactiplantibacillus mudanjiangensis]VDG20199.1 MarR family transcriptional regulator [Lactobacillus sp.] [Lactiplantibacillus mudanjiangensis]VDG24110.1 MarR family transcriptional regulator [Lactobacillus sp.] [Lactiplantibacillus mudanjiangensis]VDG30287.1 MarR family transcriptional regulator [Lactobacillus sp.] [Lactiplantibacillus mudanjiangensis]VDG33593.1 MarR family transcriptional regulator [Lactobacillus sp.] [Lactiplantibacillus mudanjiangens